MMEKENLVPSRVHRPELGSGGVGPLRAKSKTGSDHRSTSVLKESHQQNQGATSVPASKASLGALEKDRVNLVSSDLSKGRTTLGKLDTFKERLGQLKSASGQKHLSHKYVQTHEPSSVPDLGSRGFTASTASGSKLEIYCDVHLLSSSPRGLTIDRLRDESQRRLREPPSMNSNGSVLPHSLSVGSNGCERGSGFGSHVKALSSSKFSRSSNGTPYKKGPPPPEDDDAIASIFLTEERRQDNRNGMRDDTNERQHDGVNLSLFEVRKNMPNGEEGSEVSPANLSGGNMTTVTLHTGMFGKAVNDTNESSHITGNSSSGSSSGAWPVLDEGNVEETVRNQHPSLPSVVVEESSSGIGAPAVAVTCPKLYKRVKPKFSGPARRVLRENKDATSQGSEVLVDNNKMNPESIQGSLACNINEDGNGNGDFSVDPRKRKAEGEPSGGDTSLLLTGEPSPGNSSLLWTDDGVAGANYSPCSRGLDNPLDKQKKLTNLQGHERGQDNAGRKIGSRISPEVYTNGGLVTPELVDAALYSEGQKKGSSRHDGEPCVSRTSRESVALANSSPALAKLQTHMEGMRLHYGASETGSASAAPKPFMVSSSTDGLKAKDEDSLLARGSTTVEEAPKNPGVDSPSNSLGSISFLERTAQGTTAPSKQSSKGLTYSPPPLVSSSVGQPLPAIISETASLTGYSVVTSQTLDIPQKASSPDPLPEWDGSPTAVEYSDTNGQAGVMTSVAFPELPVHGVVPSKCNTEVSVRHGAREEGLEKVGGKTTPASLPDAELCVRSTSRPETESFVWVNNKRYQKIGKIGKGGSSEVFKVIASDCTIYALKRINLKGRDYVAARGFYQEIGYLQRLHGKRHIIQLIDYEVTNKSLLEKTIQGGDITMDAFIYMVLEYGEIDLACMLSAKRKEMQSNPEHQLDENWLRLYWQHILEAVRTIHEERIVHSDLKPANFLLVKGELKLIDFGIAKAIQNDTTNIVRESQVGTLNYMSPEAFMQNTKDDDGTEIKIGRASDIWSLGCILYQMVYGHTPFAHLSFYSKIKAITNPKHKIDYAPVSNPWLLDIMNNCLTWDRRKRLRIPELLQHPFLRPDLAPPFGPMGNPQSNGCLNTEQHLQNILSQVPADALAAVSRQLQELLRV